MHDERSAVLLAQAGDAEAFGSLVRRYEEVAFRAAYLIVRDDAEAQDVAQEAFVRAHRSLARFDGEKPFRPWLLRIVTNLALNSLRGAGRRREAGERYQQDASRAPVAPSPEAAVVAGDQAGRVWEAVSALRPDDQRVIYLRYFLDASEEETAAAIGRPVGTVKSRLHRALRRLRDVIDERYPELATPDVAETRTQT